MSDHVQRRRFSAFAGLAGLLAAGAASAADVMVASSGGSWQEAQDKALWAPAAAAIDIDYAQDTFQSWAEARAQVESGSVTWDIIQLSIFEEPLAVRAGILENLGPDFVDRSEFAPGSTTDYCIGLEIYSTVLGWNTATYGENPPSSVADFWDIENFPGERSMQRHPEGNIEAAVIALGQPRDKVYEFLSTEEGREAAMAKLAEIAPHVTVWWTSGAQSAQLVKDGEVDMIIAWNGRIQSAIDDGATAALTFEDGRAAADCYAIVKGAPNLENAKTFLAEMVKPQYQANIPEHISYGPANVAAYGLKDFGEAELAVLSSSPQNIAVQFGIDPDWWAEYGTWASEEFDNMILSQ